LYPVCGLLRWPTFAGRAGTPLDNPHDASHLQMMAGKKGEKRRHHGKYSLEIRDELVIVTVRTNPIPDNGLAGSNADRSP